MRKSIYSIVTSFFVLLVLFVACTKELTDDILSIKVNIFSFTLDANESELTVDEMLTFSVNIEENNIESDYSLLLESSAEGDFIFNGQTYSSNQEISVLPGNSTITYFGREAGEHKINFTITNSNTKPISQSKDYLITYIEKEKPVIEPLDFIIELDYASDELLVNETANFTLTLTEGTDVPDDTSYILKLQSSLAGSFLVDGGAYNVENGISVIPGNTTISYMGSIIGEHTITAQVENSYETAISKTESEVITYVEEPDNSILITDITLIPETIPLLVGSQQIDANILPIEATNKQLIWSSSNTSLATVSNSGLVTAVAPGGPITITATTTDGSNLTATTTITQIEDGEIPVTSILVTPSSITLEEGENQNISVSVFPQEATDKSLIWGSSNPSVATVSGPSNIAPLVLSILGEVNAVSSGTAVITVTTVDGDFSGTVNVTVESAEVSVTGVEIQSAPNSLEVGESDTLIASLLPSNATNQAVSWSSNSTGISVSTSGVITAVSPGSAEITVTTLDGNFTDSVNISVSEVYIPVTSLGTISTPSDDINISETLQISVPVFPADATNKTIIWSTSDENLATIDSNGLLTGVSGGLVRIIATSEENSAITVDTSILVNSNNPPIANLTVSPTSGTTSTIFRFNASGSSDPDGNTITYSWPLSSTSTSSTITRTFSSAGSFITNVMVTDSNGETDIASVTVTVSSIIIEPCDDSGRDACIDAGQIWCPVECRCTNASGGASVCIQ